MGLPGLLWAENSSGRAVWAWHRDQPAWSGKGSLDHGSAVAFCDAQVPRNVAEANRQALNANKVCVTVAGKREVNMILLALLGLKHNPKSPYYAKPSESHMKINFMNLCSYNAWRIII